MNGSLILLLHAHLPFVRHPEHEYCIEENWLFEAIRETYVPLLDMLERMVNDGISPHITFSISPTLAEMLNDGLLRKSSVPLVTAGRMISTLVGRTLQFILDGQHCTSRSIIRIPVQ